jgi:flagellar hook-basal body complex protein FliE
MPTVPPIDPSFAATGAEWSVNASGPAPQQPTGGGGGFGSLLAEQIQSLEQTQIEGATASRQLATGTAEDLPSVVSAVERAKLSMELASTVRTKAVEAYQEIFRTTV